MSWYIKFILFIILFIPITYLAYAKMYGSLLCHQPGYFCYTVKRGDTWSKLFQDDYQKDLVMRLNRMNIPLEKGMKIAIPRSLNNVDKMDFSPFSRKIEPVGSKIIFVSLSELAWGAYNTEGDLENWGPVSGGQGFCPDINRGCHTVIGKFNIYRKQGAGCVSTKFPVNRGGAPMPYCMFFHGGFALHGSPIVPGYNASHGCVRLFVNDAKWLNEEFLYHESNIPVIVSGKR